MRSRALVITGRGHMNQALRQRLVGAVVLVALGIIFLPSLFNGGRPKPGDILDSIPEAPEVATMEFRDPIRPGTQAAEPLTPASSLYALETEDSVDAATPDHSLAPALDKTGLPKAWVLQVASFSDPAKAEALRQALSAKAYRAFTRKGSSDRKTVVRVMVGPEVDPGKLADMKKTIDRDFKVKSLVVKYES